MEEISKDRKEKIEKEIEKLVNYRKILKEFSETENQKSKELLKEISLEEEIEYINDWIEFYSEEKRRITEREIKPVETVIKQSEPVIKPKISFSFSKLVIPVIIIMLVIAGILFIKPTITGYVTVTQEINYTQTINKEFTADTEYLLFLEKPANLRSIKLSGTISKDGYAQVYLLHNGIKYVVFDSNALTKEGIIDITGLVISNETLITSNETVINETAPKITNETNITIVNETITNIPKTITINLEYKSGTIYDPEDDGKEPIIDVIDFTIENSDFSWNVNFDRLCTKWETYSIDNDEIVTACYGSDKCCALAGLKPTTTEWDDIFNLNYGKYGATFNNIVSAQIIYADYNLSIDEPYAEIYNSEWQSLNATFYEEFIEFKDICIDTCLLTGFNETFYTLLINVSNATITIDTISYSILEEIQKLQLELNVEDSIKQIKANFSIYKDDILTNETMVEPGLYDIEIIPEEKIVEKIKLEDVNITKPIISLGIDNVTKDISIENVEIKKRFAIDSSQIEFNNATLTSTATASSLYKCKDWDFKTETCYGAWIKIKELIVGKEYNLTLMQDDPGFIEGDINITATITTQQGQAVLGKPVKWVKKVKPHTLGNLTIKIPQKATNITILKLKQKQKQELASTTGEFEIEIDDIEEEYDIEYYTEAPYSVEEKTARGKKIKVIGPDTIHYENVLAFTELDESLGVRNPSKVKIYWIENNTYINPTSVQDKNQNGIYEYIEWITPELSNQTFEIIVITKAEHLDSNRQFISDIYNETYQLDNVWSEEISNRHYVRVMFERNLTNENDITLYPRIVSGNPKIEVYEFNSTEIIATFDSLISNQYNKIYLTNLQGEQDTFDLKILNGAIEIDHIVDPTEWSEDCAAITEWTLEPSNGWAASAGTCTSTNSVDDNMTRTTNLAGRTTATLIFDWTNSKLDSGEWFYVYAGTSSASLNVVFSNQGNGGVQSNTAQTVDITSYISSTTTVRFECLGSDGGENCDIDNIDLTTTSPNTAPKVIAIINSTPDNLNLTTSTLECYNTSQSDSEGDAITVSYSWYKDNVFQDGQSSYQISSALTTKNDVWICQINATDGTAYNRTNSTTLTILNTPPIQGIPIINSSPTNANTTNETLWCFNTTQSDADNDAITTSYSWYKDNVFQDGQSTTTISSALTTKNEVWICQVNITDGTAYNRTNSTTLTILNSPPFINATVPNINANTGTAWSSPSINCTDVDGDTITYDVNDSRITVNTATGVLNDTAIESDAGVSVINASCTDGTAFDNKTFTYTVNDIIAPVTTLNYPPAGYYNDSADPYSILFNCSATDGYELQNISLYITNRLNQSFELNKTASISGTLDSANWSVSLVNGNYTWNCLVYDLYNNSDWGENRTILINYTVTNNPPLIFNVNWTSTGASGNLIEADVVSFNFTFNVSDQNGFGDINHSLTKINITLGSGQANGLATWNNSNCTISNYNTNYVYYLCTVLFNYYYNASANWVVNASVTDNAGATAVNDTLRFTVNSLTAMRLVNAVVNFSGAGVVTGAVDVAADEPLTVNNTGNFDFTKINITGQNLIGKTNSEVIGAGNITVNITNAPGIAMNPGNAITIPSATLTHGKPPTGNASFYFYVDVPSGLTAQVYNVTTQWEITLE